jgi:hypothetical protein
MNDRYRFCVGAAILSTASAGCLPLPQTYYTPAGPPSVVVGMACALGPPYAASLFGDGFHLLVDLEPSWLVTIINANDGSSVSFDPTQVSIEIDGKITSPKQFVYFVTKFANETPLISSTMLETNTGHLKVRMAVELMHAQQVVITMPAVIVNGKPEKFSPQIFNLERRTHMTYPFYNC